MLCVSLALDTSVLLGVMSISEVEWTVAHRPVQSSPVHFSRFGQAQKNVLLTQKFEDQRRDFSWYTRIFRSAIVAGPRG